MNSQQHENSSFSTIALALAVVVGLALAGWFVAGGLKQLRTADRYVTVKGLAEREVMADLVIWPISFSEAGNDLNAVYKKVDENAALVRKFVASQGLDKAEIVQAAPSVFDLQAQRYGNDSRSPYRYRAEMTLIVRSAEANAVKKAMQNISELGKQGIAFEQNGDPEYLFTQLNRIKPDLLAEATQNARKAAEQFAQNASSRVGTIRSASQGQITIVDRDRGTPQIKIVRVVTTVEYSLVDD